MPPERFSAAAIIGIDLNHFFASQFYSLQNCLLKNQLFAGAIFCFQLDLLSGSSRFCRNTAMTFQRYSQIGKTLLNQEMNVREIF
jgi:hypothetical protein